MPVNLLGDGDESQERYHRELISNLEKLDKGMIDLEKINKELFKLFNTKFKKDYSGQPSELDKFRRVITGEIGPARRLREPPIDIPYTIKPPKLLGTDRRKFTMNDPTYEPTPADEVPFTSKKLLQLGAGANQPTTAGGQGGTNWAAFWQALKGTGGGGQKNPPGSSNLANLPFNPFSKWGLGSLLSRANAPQVLGLTLILNAIREGFAEGNELQKRSLAMGFSLGDFTAGQLRVLEDLPGGIGDALEAQFQMFERGLDRNSLELLTLAVRMRATGQDSKALFQTMRDLQVQGVITNEQMDGLAGVLEDVTDSYAIKTDQLIKSLDRVTESTKRMFALEGVGPQFAEVLTKFQAMVGPEDQGLATDLINQLTQGNMESVRQQVLLGTQGMLDAFRNNPTIETLLAVVNKIAEGQKQWQADIAPQGAPFGFFMRGMVRDIVGPTGEAAVLLKDLIKQRAGQLEEEQGLIDAKKGFEAQFDQFKKLLIEPMKRFSFETLSSILEKLNSMLEYVREKIPPIFTKFALAATYAGFVWQGVKAILAVISLLPTPLGGILKVLSIIGGLIAFLVPTWSIFAKDTKKIRENSEKDQQEKENEKTKALQNMQFRISSRELDMLKFNIMNETDINAARANELRMIDLLDRIKNILGNMENSGSLPMPSLMPAGGR